MHVIYKPVGKTPKEIADAYKNEHGIVGKLAYSGRLDPMAHGQLLLLWGDRLKDMDIFNKKDKRYRFRLVLGIETDTTDMLGIVKNTFQSKSCDVSQIVEGAMQFNNYEYEQEYHHFSSMTVQIMIDGKTKKVPLWKVFKDHHDDTILIPKKKVNIYSLAYHNHSYMQKNELVDYIDEHLSSVTNGSAFRMDAIRCAWSSFFNNVQSTDVFDIFEFDAHVSSGTYIRQLVKDISCALNIKMMVIEIYRYHLSLDDALL